MKFMRTGVDEALKRTASARSLSLRRLSNILAVPLALLALGGRGDGSILPSAGAATGAPGIQAPARPRASSMEESVDSSFIREAHSDGGYWDWLERQPVD